MVFHIAKKEFLNNLLSARFLIGFLLCLVLIPFSILINVDDYRDQMSQSKIDRDAAEKEMTEVRVFSTLRPMVVFSAEPLGVFGKGLSGQVGNQVGIRLGSKPLLAEGKTAARDNPFLASFFSVDFVDIAAIIFSLLALLFSYDALTREKEDGTLRLQMANSLGRAKLLAGKVVGILMTLLPVVVFCFLLGAIIVLASRDLVYSAGEWSRLILLALVSLAYLVFFVFLGLFVSSKSRGSVSSLVVCLFLWVVLIFIVPNLASTFAESFVPIQSRDNLDSVIADMDKGLDERIQAATDKLPPSDWNMNWWMFGGSDGERETYGCTASHFERNRREMALSEPLRLDNADRKWAPQKAYLDSLSRQARVAEDLALFSPAGIFRAVATSVCGTDRRAQEKRLEDVRRYRETFVSWLKGKNLFEKYEYITPTLPSAFKTRDQLVAARTGGRFKTQAEYDAWADKEPDFRKRWQVLSTVTLPGDSPEDYPFLKLGDMPRFLERPVSAADSMAASLPRLGLLLFECIFLFALAYVAFIRYDVR
ncbi:MAG: ABC transporter permease subunit [Acidobacteriota bacterium]|nr:ABC transporter permease subunit [Acidobacteriota bacterium]